MGATYGEGYTVWQVLRVENNKTSLASGVVHLHHITLRGHIAVRTRALTSCVRDLVEAEICSGDGKVKGGIHHHEDWKNDFLCA